MAERNGGMIARAGAKPQSNMAWTERELRGFTNLVSFAAGADAGAALPIIDAVASLNANRLAIKNSWMSPIFTRADRTFLRFSVVFAAV